MAAQESSGAVRIDALEISAGIRHSVKAAALLYGAPRWILRGPIWMTFAIVVSGFVFSFWARQNVIVGGALSLQRESTTVEAIGAGMVVDIQAKENTSIEAGDPILTVQEQIRTTASPEQQAMLEQMANFDRELEKTKRDYDFKISQFELEQRDLGKRRDTDLQALSARINQMSLQVQTAQRQRSSAGERLAYARKQLATKGDLYRSRDITVTEYEQSKLSVSDLERAVNDAEAEVQRQNLTLQTTQQERQRLVVASDQERFMAEVAKLKENRDRDVERLQQHITEIEDRLRQANTLVRGVRYEGNLANYKSNFDGIVTNLHVRRGQILTPGQFLATIVKASSALEGQTYVQNKDISHLKHGQSVKIKYFAYPYQEYGIQTGVIREIATRPSTEGNRAGMYRVTIALDRETIKARDGDKKQLAMGLEGMVEVKVGDKRFIELMFSPISKFFKDPHASSEGKGDSGEMRDQSSP